MKVLGIVIKKNEIWYSVVSGTEMNNAVVVDTGKHVFRAESSVQTLMMDFSNIYAELILKFKPERIAYKLFLEAVMNQIPYMHYSLGVLNLVSKQNGIETTERTNKWITAGKKSKINKFNEYFKDHSYKNEELAATLIAWFELGDQEVDLSSDYSGQEIGKYYLIEKLGNESFGAVYRAHDRILKTDKAIKILEVENPREGV